MLSLALTTALLCVVGVSSDSTITAKVWTISSCATTQVFDSK